MAKRTAERQLTQLNQHEEEDSSDHQGSSFQRADEGELARRVIRKPKSRLRSANSAASVESAPKPAFSGFSGFGSTSSGNASAEASGSEQPPAKAAFKGFSFGQSASSTTDKDAKTPAFGSSATGSGMFKPSGFGSSGTTPAFGSGGATSAFGSSGTTPAFGASGTTPAFGSNSFGAKSSDAAEKPASSGFSFGTQTKSGFTFGKAPAPTATPAAPAAATSVPSEPEKPAVSDASKPTPASSFSFPAFKPPTADAPSTSSTGMFAKSSAPPSFKSGFVPPGGAKAESVSAEPTKPAQDATGAASDDEFYRHIRGLNASIQKKIGDAIAVNAFVDLTPLLEQYRKHWKQVTEDFKPSSGASATATTEPTKPVLSAPAKAAEDTKPAFPATTKSSMFASLSPPSTQTSKPAEPPKFTFGAQSSSSAASPPKPAGGFSFNFSKPAADNTDSDAAKKSFSFGFGKPNAAAAASDSSGAQKPAFSFGFAKPAAQSDSDNGPKTGNSAANDDDAQSDEEEPEADTARAPTTAGEEGETTVHKVRGKVYQWDNKDKQFKDLGIGNIRINTWDSDSGEKRARVLCRQETTEKITLNASMFAKMMVERKANDKNVGLLAVVDGKPTRFMIRVKAANEAEELQKALDSVIASL
ncbi:hypothetical protein GGF43_000755 [Coemansia sp. RSA 2618]|nr:hypothetical protein GGF43_000755 [Coemansia sp. RSA 2618]